jgi:hypothetical protein
VKPNIKLVEFHPQLSNNGIQWMVHWWVLVHCGPFKQGAYHTVALPFTLKSISRRKNNYGNSNISITMQKYNLQKFPDKIFHDTVKHGQVWGPKLCIFIT